MDILEFSRQLKLLGCSLKASLESIVKVPYAGIIREWIWKSRLSCLNFSLDENLQFWDRLYSHTNKFLNKANMCIPILILEESRHRRIDSDMAWTNSCERSLLPMVSRLNCTSAGLTRQSHKQVLVLVSSLLSIQVSFCAESWHKRCPSWPKINVTFLKYVSAWLTMYIWCYFYYIRQLLFFLVGCSPSRSWYWKSGWVGMVHVCQVQDLWAE